MPARQHEARLVLRYPHRCGGHRVELCQKECWQVLQRWREVYAADLHAITGKWKDGEFEWHAFLRGHARILNGGKAAAAYHARQATTIIVCPDVVCPENTRLPAVRMVEARPPDFRAESVDVLVWPEDLTWAMAFTHEESLGLGPYFSRREWVSAAAASESLGTRKARK